MNLAATLTIHCGGPGSGCNPSVGKCGRPGIVGDKDYETYWHGTLQKSAAKILKEGLHQDEKQRFRLKKVIESKPGYVYMTKDRNFAEHFAVLRASTSTTGEEEDLPDWQDTPAIVELRLPLDIVQHLEQDPDERTEIQRHYGTPIKLPPAWMLKGDIPKEYVVGVKVLEENKGIGYPLFSWKDMQAQAGVPIYLVYHGDLDALKKHLGLS